jgi:hypothetical protein
VAAKEEMNMGAHFFDVRPRYTPGSPAAVSEAVALRVAQEEKEGHEYALTGRCGVTEQTRAQTEGLGLISIEMREKPTGWQVRDLITGELWFWPHKGACRTCYAKNVTCKRGYLTEHDYPQKKGTSNRYVPCDSRAFVGKKLEDFEW